MTNVAAIRLRDDVDLASTVVAPSWPLSQTIAVNPLSGFEDRRFSVALRDASMLFGTSGLLPLEDFRTLHQQGRIARADVLAALRRALPGLGLDQEHVLLVDLIDGASEPPPQRVLATVVEQHDARAGTAWAAALANELADGLARGELAPGAIDDPIGPDAVDQLCVDALAAFEALRVPAYAQRRYIERILATLPGWVAHLRWRERTGQQHVLLRFVAAAVTGEARLVAGRAWFTDDGPLPRRPASSLAERAAAVAAHLDHGSTLDEIAAVLELLPSQARALVWQDAFERSVHDRILASIAPPADRPTSEPAGAQVVCCIDVRSEPLRRHLEASGRYETHGYAGFFGLAARVEPLGGGEGTDRCPVLIAPTTTISVDAGDPTRRRLGAAAEDAWDASRHHPIAPLAVAEAAGWLAGPLAALRTVRPRRSGRVVAPGAAPDVSAIPIEDQVAIVGNLLAIGVGRAPAPLVVLCGHSSHSTNNPTESGLACGACGGNGGAENARAVAAMANDPEVRARLAAAGTPIPDTTWFVGAEHDTALDRVRVLDPVPDSHAGALASLERDLEAATVAVTAERAQHLPGSDGDVAKVRRRAFDWAEPVAELGLAGNAAFIVGPRSMTAAADLKGRAFLHSYEPSDDHDGSTLAGILSAPMVVAQWINAQYHFSTTDPELLGAGTKAVHNVIGDIGVLSGPGGDLRRGLPLQSVRAGDRLLHEPVRLLVAVHGHPEHVDAALASSPTVRQLVEHEWVILVAREPGTERWRRRTADGWADHPITRSTDDEAGVAA